MSDIVERLRKRGWGSNVTDTLNRWDSERTEAAAEIARLRAELAEARDKALDEAAGELERLDGFGEWHEASEAIRALKSRKGTGDE